MTFRVLITHPAGVWPALAARFQDTPVSLQMTETATQLDPVDPGPGDRALSQLASYAWLVVTSARGASALAQRLKAKGVTLPHGLRVAAVGPATVYGLRAMGIEADVVAEEATGAGLASSLRSRLSEGARVLLIRPEGPPGPPGPLASALAAVGAAVDVAPLYRTVASDHAGALASAAIGGEFAAVVFTAPSSLDRWLDAARDRRAALIAALSKTVRVAIGPTTATHLQEAGLPAQRVAAAPTEAAIGDAIAAVFHL